MAEEKRQNKTSKLDLNSKFWKTFLVILAALLTFAGPTYVAYVFIYVLEIDYIISMVSGFILFLIGVALMWYLIRKKVIF